MGFILTLWREILCRIRMRPLAKLLAEGNNFLNVLLDDHGPEIFDCVFFGALGGNDKSKWLLDAFLWIWMNFLERRFDKTGVDVLAHLDLLDHFGS